MPSPRPEYTRRALRRLGPAALLVLGPKCVLCVLVWSGLGAALGFGGPELCGAAADGESVAWIVVPAIAGLAAVLGRAILRDRVADLRHKRE